MSHQRVINKLAATVAVAISIPAFASALPERIVFERMGRERGFPSETVTAIVRDHAGFLWVGTREGLAVYDGYEVRVYQHNVGDPASLSDDTIRRIFEDTSGRLWIGTDAGGLQWLDRATGKFTSFHHDANDPKSLSHEGVYAIAEGKPGVLWVGTKRGLDRMDVATGKFDHFEAKPDDPASLPNAWVYDVHRDHAGRVWAATVGGGICWLDPASGRFTRVPFATNSQASSESQQTFAIAENAKGELWFGALDGIFRYDEKSASLTRAPIPDIRPEPKPAIATFIAFDRSGTLWVTTWNKGLIAYDPVTGTSRAFRHDPRRDDALATDRLSALAADSVGDVWVGSWGQGIYRFSSDAGLFSTIVERRGDPSGLPYHEVTSVLEDSAGTLWVGTWGEGLCRRPKGSRLFTRVEPPGSFEAMSTPTALAEEPGGDVWTGTIGGLFLVGRDGRVKRDYHGPELAYVNALALDAQGRLWIGSGGGGLTRLENDRKTSTYFRNDPKNPSSLSDDVVTSLRFDKNGALWIGTRAGGVNRLDPATGTFTRLTPNPTDPHSLPHHTVTSILEDKKGTIWVGTAGGLARIDPAANGGAPTVTRVTVADGLVNGSVVAIQEDDDGSLWIGTRRGLSRFEPATGRFHNYGPGDGLPSLEFRASAARPGTSELYFGTLGGIVGIARGTTFFTPAPTPTVVTAIRTQSGPWAGPVPAWEASTIEVPYGTMLSLEFDVLDLRPPHRFLYRLEGESNEWIDLASRRDITFAQLRPGRYALSVKGLSARGVWNETATPLRLQVLPPFWMTWWFRSALALAAIAATWTWIHFRVRTLARRNRKLEALHREREAALTQARTSQQELHGAYERLRGLTRRLEDAKEEERRRIARELHDEMGQALSAVKLNLKVLGRLSSEDESATARVGDALALVDGIIGHVRALSLDLRPPLLDELGLVVALRGYAEGQSERSGIPIAVEANADAGEDIPADIAIAAFRIVQESIHNVVRHAAATSITVSVRRDSRRLSLAVRDDGGGFDLKEALERAATGRHLGLLGMRERVEALSGSFRIESERGRGTSVEADIPLQEHAAAAGLS